ncbi:MAG: hypothetical protein ACTHJM_03005 [Marmoricola sp.]
MRVYRLQGLRGIGLAAAFLAVASVAGVVASAVASGSPTDSTSVGFISITPHRVLTNVSIASKHSSSPVVIGGTTTVPTDVTTVQLSISAHSVSPGAIAVYPAGDPEAADDHFISYPKTTAVTVTDNEHPGTANEVTLTNNGASAVVVTLSITGYSTEVNSASINGAGGSPGQVLTNTGSGTQWQTPTQAYGMYGEGAGLSSHGSVTIARLNVPAGSFDLLATLEVSGGAGQVSCWMYSPRGATVTSGTVVLPAGGTTMQMVLDGLLTTGGGWVTISCDAWQSNPQWAAPIEFRALQLGGATGGAVVEP